MEKIEKLVGIGKIEVGIGDCILKCIGLGSCVALSLTNRDKNIAGMAHVMLPESSKIITKESIKKGIICETAVSIKDKISKSVNELGFELSEADDEASLKQNLSYSTDFVIISRYFFHDDFDQKIKDIKIIYPNVKIILLTPNIGLNEIKRLYDLGCDEVILEPFVESQVKAVINCAFGMKSIRFADVAVPTLIYNMNNKGFETFALEAKIVGGANLFSNLQSFEIGHIGEKNVEQIKKHLRNFGVRIVAEDTGKDFGRTARLDVMTGEISVKTKNIVYNI